MLKPSCQSPAKCNIFRRNGGGFHRWVSSRRQYYSHLLPCGINHLLRSGTIPFAQRFVHIPDSPGDRDLRQSPLGSVIHEDRPQNSPTEEWRCKHEQDFSRDVGPGDSKRRPLLQASSPLRLKTKTNRDSHWDCYR